LVKGILKMARIKGGQRLQWMSKNSRPVPGRASIIPGLNSMGLRPGESYVTDDSVPLGESEDVFRAGYTDPRAQQVVTPPKTTLGNPLLGEAQRVVEAAKGTPEQQEKERKINELNAEIDRIVAEAGFDPETGEKTPETAYQGPEKEYLEQPTKDGAFPNAATPAKEEAATPQSKLDVLKEMNKAIKEFTKDDGPPRDKVGSSGMPDWAESGTGIVGRGATPPAAPTPPPPMDQVGKEWREEWATTPPPPPAVAAPTAPTAPTAVVTDTAPALLFSDEELQNLNSLSVDNLPNDRLILPVVVQTPEEGAALMDSLDEENKPVPPVLYIKSTGEYFNLAVHPEYSRFVYGPEDIKEHNLRVFMQLQGGGSVLQQNLQQNEQRLKQVNQQLGK
jgi:hypothetical protein